MSTFQYFMVGFCVLFAFVAPIALAKTIRRRQWQRFYELVVTTLFAASFGLQTAFPAVLQQVGHLWRWPFLVLALLFLANWFGFSGWLFRRLALR